MTSRSAVIKPKPPVIIKKTLLGYELDSRQNVYVNYLIPSVLAAIFYVFYYACDIACSFRHFSLDNPIWGSLTLFFMYIPVLGCFVVTISSWELWPELEGCSVINVKWAFWKISEHIFFPVWCMWRYAEKIFWSIEALRTEDEDDRESALTTVTAPRTVELYLFLQGYLHTAPQIFLQLHILMRHVSGLDSQTMGIQAASIIMNLIKMAITTTIYQRFKKQKIGGKDYPWFKRYKHQYCPTLDEVDSKPKRPRSSIIYCTKNSEFKIRETLKLQEIEEQIAFENKVPPPYHLERRRSSELYLEPIETLTSYNEETLQTRPKSDKEDEVVLRNEHLEGISQVDRETTNIQEWRRSSDMYLEPISILNSENEQTITFRPVSSNKSEKVVLRNDLIDIPKRVIDITTLPEDDYAGKCVSFLWWFCFLIARMLTISAFAYFYSIQILWVLGCHFTLTIAFLFYDAQAVEVRRRKAIFFIFVGLVYLFCLIEFKIRFKKAKFWYYGFFTITYLENFIMSLVWYFVNLEDILTNDWWFKYTFYLILICSSLSVVSMITYIRVDKPKSVAVEEHHVSVLIEEPVRKSFIRSMFKSSNDY